MLLGFGESLAIKYVSLNNQPSMVRPRLINLYPDELHHYPFIISLDRHNGSCNTVEDPFGRICVLSDIEDANLKVFNMIKGRNESKPLIKHLSYKCRCEFEGRKFNSNKLNLNSKNNDKYQCEREKPIKHPVCEEDYAWNPTIHACECDKDYEICE